MLDLHTLVTSTGLTAENIGENSALKNASTNEDNVFINEIDTVVIATRHNLHADQVVRALKAQKNVFVEKPLALNLKEIERIELELSKSNSILMVGYNRRFSPYIKKIKRHLTQKVVQKLLFIQLMQALFQESLDTRPRYWWRKNYWRSLSFCRFTIFSILIKSEIFQYNKLR